MKSYLKSMELKTKAFGGYDPEDVILKMTEVAKLARSEEHQQCQQLEQELSAQTEKLRQTEVSLEEISEQLRQAETEKQRMEAELLQLRAQLATKPEPAPRKKSFSRRTAMRRSSVSCLPLLRTLSRIYCCTIKSRQSMMPTASVRNPAL